CLQYYSDPYSF
nr:immunoglobulin light chain junction region [Macaca mulatta]MOW09975.1 immunoglobulin light chain junction region [Macaca mulatta]